jgi:hypothetical protein
LTDFDTNLNLSTTEDTPKKPVFPYLDIDFPISRQAVTVVSLDFGMGRLRSVCPEFHANLKLLILAFELR